MGNGVRSADAVEMFHEFAQKTNIPVLTTMNGVDLAQDDLHIGFIGTHGNRIANMILNECDLIISAGARLGIRQVGRTTQKFAPKADLVPMPETLRECFWQRGSVIILFGGNNA